MAISLTVGKLDAGLAILLTQDRRLIEFPSILLPANLTPGSIVDITVSHNHKAEFAATNAFNNLQTEIYETFGKRSPSPPVLRLRNATQTSVVLEWDSLSLETAKLTRGGLSLWRNGSKAGNIPKPLTQTSTKISGLSVDTEYTFHLLLTTSAGTYTSNILKARTHKLTDLSGITITPGNLPTELLTSLTKAVARIGGKMIDSVRIDTTHFVTIEGKGEAWERASEMNIPVVRPEWVEGCEREGRLVGVRGYYLGANPKDRQIGPGVAGRPQSRREESQGGSQRPALRAPAQQPPTPASAGLNSVTSPKMVNEPGTPQRKVDVPIHGKTRPPIHDFTEELKDDSELAQSVAPPSPPANAQQGAPRPVSTKVESEEEGDEEADGDKEADGETEKEEVVLRKAEEDEDPEDGMKEQPKPAAEPHEPKRARIQSVSSVQGADGAPSQPATKPIEKETPSTAETVEEEEDEEEEEVGEPPKREPSQSSFQEVTL